MVGDRLCQLAVDRAECARFATVPGRDENLVAVDPNVRDHVALGELFLELGESPHGDECVEPLSDRIVQLPVLRSCRLTFQAESREIC
jgi:hypothetical protein